MKTYWEVKAKANKTGELLLYGDIASQEMRGGEITPTQIDTALKALGDIDTLNVYINSGGGSVFAGMAIHNIIKRFKASMKNAYVDGVAASISSVIPMACDKIFMPSNSLMMIHNPSGFVMGNSGDMLKMADLLDKTRDLMVMIYKEKSGLPEPEIIRLLDAETWMTAEEAIGMHFADELQAEIKIAASVNGNFLTYGNVKVDTSVFKNFKPERVETYRAALPEPVAILQNQNEHFNKIKLKLLEVN